MRMTLKNKMLLGIEKLIVEAKEVNGNPKNIEFSFEEGIELVLEIATNPKNVSIKHENNADIRFIIRESTTPKEAEDITQRWYDGEFSLQYNDIGLVVITPSISILEAEIIKSFKTNNKQKCNICNSKLHKKWIFFNTKHCVEIKCENYWLRFEN